MTSLPYHVTRPGDIIGAPPYRADGCVMHSILVKGDLAAQQAHVDLVLNSPAKGHWVFKALSDFLLLNAVYVDTMRSLDPVDGQKGVIAETDIGFWSPVRGGPRDQPTLHRTYWMPSFLYVDTPSAMTSGREVYGYPKTACTITRGVGGRDDPTVDVHALHLPRFGPAERPRSGRLLQIDGVIATRDDRSVEAEIQAAWANLNVEAPQLHGKVLPPSSIVMPQLLLRQFRDPFVLGRASLQEGLVAEPVALQVRGVGLLQAGATLRLGASASHPVVETLGVAATSAVNGFWIEQDFELGAAQPLWP